MLVELSEVQLMTKKLAHELAVREILPLAGEIDETRRFPAEIIDQMARAGLFGILIPAMYGGAGGERLDYLLAVEEIAMASASVASIYVKSSTVAFLIATFGTEEQKQRYLPAMARGETLGAMAITETDSGANWALTLRSRATRENDLYVLHGSKDFISNAGEAGVYVVLARTEPGKGPAGISAFLLEKDTPGLSFGAHENKLGLRATPAGDIVIDDCRVPASQLLGKEGEGAKLVPPFAAMVCIGQAAMAVGIAQAALDASIAYTKSRTIDEPRTVAHLEQVQATIADRAIAVETARLLTHRAVLPAGTFNPRLMLSAAVFSEPLAVDVTSKAITLHGRYGSARDFPLERYFRDAKTLSLHPVLDVVRTTVGKIVLGLV